MTRLIPLCRGGMIPPLQSQLVYLLKILPQGVAPFNPLFLMAGDADQTPCVWIIRDQCRIPVA